MEIKNITTCVLEEKLAEGISYDFRGYKAGDYEDLLNERLDLEEEKMWHYETAKDFLEENGFVLKQLDGNKELYQKEV